MSVKYQVKATKPDGEVYYIYNGVGFESFEIACLNADDCNKFYAPIKFEVVDYDSDFDTSNR